MKNEKRVVWKVDDSPGISGDFKDDDVTAVKNGDDDHEHQEQEADEKHESLNGHSCKHDTETYIYFQHAAKRCSHTHTHTLLH